ncbi:MAG: hypothetical protein E7174_03795 [Firmicutes bacterium]|nr:hypothetical protein [Bacillota bacterium]
MDIEFNSVKELYERLKPALTTKETELKRNDLDYIKIEDIWNYLKDSKWSKANNLLLYQMVDDILNLDNNEIDEYVKGEIRKKVIQPNLENMKWDDDYDKKEE